MPTGPKAQSQLPPVISVLIVDDNFSFANALKEYLLESKKPRFSATPVTSGKDGIAKLKSMQFDIVLLDYILPNEFSEELLATFVEKGLAVVMVTGIEGDKVWPSLFRRGAQEFISKSDISPAFLIHDFRPFS